MYYNVYHIGSLSKTGLCSMNERHMHSRAPRKTKPVSQQLSHHSDKIFNTHNVTGRVSLWFSASSRFSLRLAPRQKSTVKGPGRKSCEVQAGRSRERREENKHILRVTPQRPPPARPHLLQHQGLPWTHDESLDEHSAQDLTPPHTHRRLWGNILDVNHNSK